MSKSSSFQAELGLVLACVLWGATFPLVHLVLQEISPFAIVVWRGILASLVLLPFIAKKYKPIVWVKCAPWGLLLGALFTLAYVCQTMGLGTLTSGRSAFLTNMSVVFVPLLSPLFGQKGPTWRDLACAVLALTGLLFLTDFSLSQGSWALSIGDFWTLGCALSFSVQILLLQKVMARYTTHTLLFAFLQVLGMIIFAAPFLPQESLLTGGFQAAWVPHTLLAWGYLVFLGSIALVGTVYLQARCQPKTTAERASVIYILEPVFATALAYFLVEEPISLSVWVGGSLIVSAVIFPLLLRRRTRC